MKVQVRRGVFETNSSSTHAISICEFKDDVEIPETIEFKTSEYGWEFENYTDVESKASYLWTAICSQYSDISDEEKLINIKNELTHILKEAGVKNVLFFNGDYSKNSWSGNMTLDYAGYIDHASDLYGWAEEMIDEPNLLLGYLFNNESTVATGNDNSDISPQFVDSAIYTIYKSN